MKSILVIRGGALGDFLVTLPALRLLRERWPRARIELLGYPRTAELGVGRYYLDAARSIDRGPMANFFIPNGLIDPEWEDYFFQFDLILSYFFDPDKIFETNLRRCTEGRIISASPQVADQPAARHFCAPLQELGLETADFAGKIHLKEEDHAAAAAWLGAFSGRLLGLHPGSGGESKNWPLDRWISWIASFCAKTQLTPLVFTGEADESRLRILRSRLNIPALWADRLDLPLVAALLHRCQAYAGHDTGITHLAAAVGCRTLALFGPTDPAVWAPPHPLVRVLRPGVAMADLSVDDVAAALREMLA